MTAAADSTSETAPDAPSRSARLENATPTGDETGDATGDETGDDAGTTTAPASDAVDPQASDEFPAPMSDASGDPQSDNAEPAVTVTAVPEDQVPETAEPDPSGTGAVSISGSPSLAASEPAPPVPPVAVDAPVIPKPPATGPVPRPVPRPMPRPAARPAATPPAASAATGSESTGPAVQVAGQGWGRVTDDGTVSVREGDQWREVGQYPDGTPAEALAYFERKFGDLASEVSLLEARHRRGGASATDLRSTARALHDKLQGAAAVGDLAALQSRVAALVGELSAASASEAAAAREAVAAAVTARTALVEQAEALAGKDPGNVQWKQASADLSSLFDQWQSQQQNGPRLPKSTGQQLWKRFRDARAILDKHRREFYSELDEAHKAVRDHKSRLVERAEALAPKGEDGIAAYRELLDQWKTAGRAGKKADDALWARFKAAGDALYSARGKREAAEVEESREKIVAKRALLDEARTIADERNVGKARRELTGIQRRWDDIGRIFPRDKERALDDELRRIETALRGREEIDWQRNNPETKARANDMTRQLSEAIQKLEDELAAATKSGNASAIQKATEALEARRAWLSALGGS